MKANHKVNAGHDIKTELTPNAGDPVYKKVKVIVEGGILKNGTHYAEGEEAVIVASAAEGLEAIGDVKILDDADMPESVQQEIDNAKNT